MNRNIKLTLEYDGSGFNGWQTQTARLGNARRPGQKDQRTVQGEIEKVLKKIFKQTIKLTGSGRTDTGVHALGQVAHFQTGSPMGLEEIQSALNANLPEDTAVLKVEEVPLKFHSQYSVKSKTYRYTILNRRARCALNKNYVLHYPNKLNITAMRREAKALIGRKDFKSFTASDPAQRKANKAPNTIRTIKKIDIKKTGPLITIDVEANGFLYKMVRNIVGTLLDAGRGKLAAGSVKAILARKDRRAAGNTAKAKGLALLAVKY